MWQFSSLGLCGWKKSEFTSWYECGSAARSYLDLLSLLLVKERSA